MVNMTNLTSVHSLQGVAYYTNNYVGGVLFDGAMFVFFVIILMGLLKFNDFEDAFLTSCWTMFIVSAFFWLAHLVNIMVMLGFLIMSSFSGLYIFFNNRR